MNFGLRVALLCLIAPGVGGSADQRTGAPPQMAASIYQCPCEHCRLCTNSAAFVPAAWLLANQQAHQLW